MMAFMYRNSFNSTEGYLIDELEAHQTVIFPECTYHTLHEVLSSDQNSNGAPTVSFRSIIYQAQTDYLIGLCLEAHSRRDR